MFCDVPYIENAITSKVIFLYLAIFIIAFSVISIKNKSLREFSNDWPYVHTYTAAFFTLPFNPIIILPIFSLYWVLDHFIFTKLSVKRIRDLEAQGAWGKYNSDIIQQKEKYHKASAEEKAEIQAYIASLPKIKPFPLWLKLTLYFGFYGVMFGILCLLS